MTPAQGDGEGHLSHPGSAIDFMYLPTIANVNSKHMHIAHVAT